MAFCTSCGAQVSGAFCSTCGTPARTAQAQGAAVPPPVAPVAASVPAGPPVARKTSPVVWILVAVLAFFIIGGAMIAMFITFAVHRAARNAGVSFRDGGVAITARDRDGKRAVVEFGGSADRLPSWVPAYPGSKPVWSVHASGDDAEQGGNFTFSTRDAPSKVISFYEDKSKDLGMNVNLNTSTGEGGMIVATEENGSRSLTIAVGQSGRETTVNVTYASK